MTARADGCIFCAIVAGEVPSDELGRGARAVAIKDLHPQAPFHALVIPADHHGNAAASAAADPSVLGDLVLLADEVARAAGHDDYRLVANTGAGAGQTVFHTHLHVLAGTSRMTESLV